MGAAVGGFVGYFTGRSAAGTVVGAWYSRINEEIRQRLDAWIVSISYPVLLKERASLLSGSSGLPAPQALGVPRQRRDALIG